MENETYQMLKSFPKGSAEQRAFYDSLSPEVQAQMNALKATEGAAPAPAPEVVAPSAERTWGEFFTPPEPTSGQRAARRGLLQGLTFGTSEEIGSVPNMVTDALGVSDDFGMRTAQEYRDMRRGEMDQMMTDSPGAYLGGEVGGAVAGSMIPGVGWVTGPVRATRAATLAGKIARPLLRGAVVGGTDAALQAAGRGEGYGERLGPAIGAVPVGMVFGGVTGPAAELLTPAISAVARRFGRTTSVAVERNVREIAAKTGLPVDEVLRRIGAGQPLAGMNDTTRMAARAIKNLSPGAGEEMVAATGARLDDAVGGAVTDVQTALVGSRLAAVPNMRAAVEPALNDARVAAGTALNDARVAAGPAASLDVIAGMAGAAQRNPDVARQINQTLRRAGQPPLFGNTPQGPQLIRQPTLQEAEILQRELSDMASSAYKPGGLVSTTQAEAMDETARGLRTAVDAEAPQLGPLREDYANAKVAQKEAYPLGLTARSTPPDVFSMAYAPLAEISREAARRGTAVSIGEAVGKSRRDTSLINEMMDPGRFLGANVDQMAVTPVNRAPGSPLATAQNEGRLMDTLTGNSSTAAQAQAMADLRGVPALGTPLSDTASANPLRLLEQAVGAVLGPETGLDDAGLRALGQMMMQSGPEGQAVMQKVLTRSVLTRGETVSLARMARAAAGVGTPAAAGGILDMMQTGGE